MSTEYRIQPCENGFLVIDPWGEQLVHIYPTEDAARQDTERCKKEEAMWETAKLLVDAAIKARRCTAARMSPRLLCKATIFMVLAP
jgi:hypothetical protein